MHLHGSQTLPGTPDALWDDLFDPEVIAATIPGCRSLTPTGPGQYAGKLEMRVGPFASTFDATFEVVDKRRPTGYTILTHAHGKGLQFEATTRVRLAPDGAAETEMVMDVEAEIGGGLGALSAMGQPYAQALMEQGLADLRQKLVERHRQG